MAVSSPPPFSPMDIGLPEKFSQWRTNQFLAVERVMDTDKRFVVLCLPTGAGKTAIYYSVALLSGARTAVLTATKGLQDQIRTEMESLSKDIRGLGNYRCPIAQDFGMPPYTSVDEAPCQCGYKCRLKWSGCEYYDRYRQAQTANIFVTNYQCWMWDKVPDRANGDLQFGPIPDSLDIVKEMELREEQKVRLLVGDECHDIMEQLSMFVGVDISRRECFAIDLEWPNSGEGIDYWQQWAGRWKGRVESKIKLEEDRLKGKGPNSWSVELKKLRDMKRKLERLADIRVEDEWVLNETKEYDNRAGSMMAVQFAPLNPARYAEDALWRRTDKVVLVSATARPKTAELLGISSDDLEFIEHPSTFAVIRRPIIHVPTVKMDYRTEQDDVAMKRLLMRLDSIIEGRLDRKGIIHAVSYDRMTFVLNNSEHKLLMMGHNRKDKAEIVERFKSSDPPSILVSPSVDTGYDFKDDECRYQIILKIPFASVKDLLVKERQKRDPEYGLYMAAQKLVQSTGRPVRSESDWAETIILDNSIQWFVRKARKFLPAWWLEAFEWADGLPEPVQECVWCGEVHRGGPENCAN